MNPWSFLSEFFEGPRHPGRVPGMRIVSCTETARPLAGAVLATKLRGSTVFLLPDNDQAERFAAHLQWHLEKNGVPDAGVTIFPGLEVDPYRGISPHPQILAQRCLTLWKMLAGEAGRIVTTPDSLLRRLPAPDDFIGRLVEFRQSLEMDLPRIRARLFQAGYKLEDPVTEVGEFAVRGGVLDVFPPNHSYPLRVEFFGDFVDSIRYFDPATQRSVETLPAATVIPMTPFAFDPAVAAGLLPAFERSFESGIAEETRREIQENLAAGLLPPGGEFLLPLLNPLSGSLFDYLEQPVTLLFSGLRWPEWAATFLERQARLETESRNRGWPALPPASHYHLPASLHPGQPDPATIFFDDFAETDASAVTCRATATSSFLGNFTGLVRHLAATHEHVLFVLSSHGRCERIHDICEEYGIGHSWIEKFGWADLDCSGPRRIVITQGPLERGFRLPDLSLAILGSEDIFPRTRSLRKEPASRRAGGIRAFFSDFRDLKPGDVVVHVDHGVGIFRGLEKLAAGGVEQEFARLEYAEKAKLYVPVERMDLIQKYSGAEGTPPPLDRLGAVTWQKTRTRVKKALRDMAQELLQIYARRSIAAGVAFPPDDHWQREFEDIFEYDETPDQLRALAEIKQDMQSPRPMDRLLCGDVGYGKTEVGMRAAFKATGSGRQVAVLAPTTVLAFQHFNTFTNRFASFPIRIELLSRFRNPREQKAILADLAEGKIDVLIGTHRLLSKDVVFKNLGLLIVDEEQRFGVTHKERIKKLRADIDVLTMSATPIPRTLYMSIAGIRDVSVIETPPKDRLSIQTQVVRTGDEVIAEAIRHELARQGQTYFVHNRVETIHAMAAHLRELVPEARLVVAHGQMREQELERIILDFIQCRYDVLVSTTIIENGIDIPLVNTIIINQAQRFGLAQLYQLRGRVGRSNRKAYAWLLVPSTDGLSDTARKRLAAIRDFTELGAGFRLAALDLEIRGAGDLLGTQQHGHINLVGFEMYCRLLEDAVKELRGELFVPPETLKLNLHVKLQIPSEYIPQEEQRLHLYKRIASVAGEEELLDLRAEIQDRYGIFPQIVEYLFEYVRLKLLALDLHLLAIERKQDRFLIQLTADSRIDPDILVKKIQRGDPITFSPDGTLSLKLPFSNIPEMFGLLKKALVELSTRDRI